MRKIHVPAFHKSLAFVLLLGLLICFGFFFPVCFYRAGKVGKSRPTKKLLIKTRMCIIHQILQNTENLRFQLFLFQCYVFQLPNNALPCHNYFTDRDQCVWEGGYGRDKGLLLTQHLEPPQFGNSC